MICLAEAGLRNHTAWHINLLSMCSLLVCSCSVQTRTFHSSPKKSSFFFFYVADALARYMILAKRELVLKQLALLWATNPVPAMVSYLDLTLQPTVSTGARPATASNPSAERRRPDCQAIRQRLRKLEASFPEQLHKVHKDKVLAVK